MQSPPRSNEPSASNEKQSGTQPGRHRSQPQGTSQNAPQSASQGAGRYAPSPSGDLHFGNLRTALLSWLYARSTGRQFFMRVEDIDQQRSSMDAAQHQLEDLDHLGLEWDGEVIYQQDRYSAYEEALAKLPHYECYCSRKDIQEASRAPHAIPGQYPGTCRNLSEEERKAQRALLVDASRIPALRLRSEVSSFTVHDELAGNYTGEVDDMILRRGGNANQMGPLGPDWAYNLAVVVDDGEQGIDQVVRGDDLLSSAPRQAYLAQLLGYDIPQYVHVPLVLNHEGKRLAKRDGAVTLREMLEESDLASIIGHLAQSLGYEGIGNADELLEAFDPVEFAQHGSAHKPFTWTNLL